MALELVSNYLSPINVYNVLFYRLAKGHAIFLTRTFLQHIKTVNELSINVMLTLSC